MSEIHLFIIWKNALNKFDEIKEDIQKKFNIKDIIKVNWTEEKFSENMTRFYGQFLPKGSFKEEHVGIGEFLCIIVEDKSPQYSERNTSRGGEVVNVNMFDAKVLYRELTGGGHKIHATNNLEETKHNLYFLFKKDYDFYKKIEFDGNIKTFSKDLVGSNGWDNLDDFFYCINQFCNYIVMRNFECIPDEYTMEGHGDIDLLVEEAQLIDVLNPQYNDIGSTFIHNKKCYFYSWLRSICDDIWMLIKNSFDRNFINVYPIKLFTFISEEEIEFVTRYSDVFTPFFSMFTSNDVWIRYDKKRMIVSILDKSVIPDIVTPDDIIYHTESLL